MSGNALKNTMENKQRKEQASMSDISKMSDDFHDWLEKCPVQWSKKYGESVYTFWEKDEDEE